MNNKPFVLLIVVLCLAVGCSGLYAGEEPKALTVGKIAFTRDKAGGERITLFCNQACTPELSSVEEENPRVVMDMKGVSLIQAKARNINTGGKLVKKVRSYLDKQTKILRIVLDMESSKYYRVRPMQNPPANTYVLTVYEAASSSEQKPGGSKGAGASPPAQGMRITILPPDLRAGGQEVKPQGASSRSEKIKAVRAAKDVPSVDQGRSQLNAGEFAAAVDTFTQILAAHPKDSLSYRLRGNAYDNLSDRKKAVEDWTRAARLGDTTMQSYLDFLKVKWRGKPAP